MNDLERQIANMLIPEVSPELDARISKLIRTSEQKDRQQDGFPGSVNASSIEPVRASRKSRMTPMLIRISLATVAIALIALILSLTLNIGIQPVAFGQVQDSVGQIKTASYLCVLTCSMLEKLNGDELGIEVEEPFVSQSEIQERVNFLLSKLNAPETGESERAERNAELSAIQPLLAEGAPRLTCLCWLRISGRDRCRTETVLPKGQGMMQVSIFNGRVGKHIARDDEQKQFYNLGTFEVANGTTSQKFPDGNANFFNDILSIPENDAERLPEKMIDGKSVIGYSIKFGDMSTKTYWIDTVSRLPVRIEEMGSDGFFLNQAVLSAFIYDAQLDESLFDVKIPDGYEVFDFGNISAAVR